MRQTLTAFWEQELYISAILQQKNVTVSMYVTYNEY